MTANPDKARARASEQATDWLILLQDDPDDTDLLGRFEAWLAESPLHVEAWAVTERVVGTMGRMPPSFADRWRPLLEAHRAGRAITPLAASRRVMPRWRRPLRVGGWRWQRVGYGLAGTALAACLAVIVAPTVILHLQADHITGTAESRTIALADGSTVVLAPDSAIRVAYADGERRVDLLSGEAFFKVVHNASRPFRVAAGDVETTDLGTVFDVRRSDEDAQIAVQQGSVRVDHRSAQPPTSTVLRAGQMVRVAWKTGAMARGEEPAGVIAAWRQNQLIAQDAPMRDVIDRLRPYYAGRIIFNSAGLADQKVTGVYNLADPVDALQGIAQAHGAAVHRITPWILWVSEE